jgi:23S rRNA pseudouridine1911/1915/1917 synthase
LSKVSLEKIHNAAHRNYLLISAPAEAGMRLDQFLATHIAELSRTLAKKIIDLGGVHVGGRRVRQCSLAVRAGEQVEVFLDTLPLQPFVLEPSAVLFRDPYLLALDKPAGIPVQPTPARYKGTIYAALEAFLHNPYRPLDRPALGMVQRLDQETSGVMVFSIHPRAHKALTASFAGREVHKEYRALLHGTPPQEGEIRSLLARSRRTGRVQSVPAGGKEAITRYRILQYLDGAAWAAVQILTGRSHQIRAHLAEAGHPLLGDHLYGGPRSCQGQLIPRTMLHAWQLSLAHPVSGEQLVLQAPLPGDMAELLGVLGGGFEPGRPDLVDLVDL